MRCKVIFSLSLLFSVIPLLNGSAYESPPKADDPVVEAGHFIDLADGGRLQLFIDDKQIVAYFVSAEGLLVPSPAESILFIIDDPGHRSDEWRTVLTPQDSLKLTSPRRLFGPYDFRARVIIRYREGEPASFANVPVDLEKDL